MFYFLSFLTFFSIVQLQTLLALKRQRKDLKVFVSVGGPNSGDKLSDVVASESTLDQFVSSVVEYLWATQVDGVDVSWIYPKAEQKDQFTAFLQVRIGCSRS